MSLYHAAIFAASFAALYAAHQFGDHWVQTNTQAATKGQPGWAGRLADLRHVATLTATKVTLLVITFTACRIPVPALPMTAALAIDAASHYWADRRATLAKLARVTGGGLFYALGQPRQDRDDNPSLGTGAYALDQSWHVLWLWITALLIAAI